MTCLSAGIVTVNSRLEFEFCELGKYGCWNPTPSSKKELWRRKRRRIGKISNAMKKAGLQHRCEMKIMQWYWELGRFRPTRMLAVWTGNDYSDATHRRDNNEVRRGRASVKMWNGITHDTPTVTTKWPLFLRSFMLLLDSMDGTRLLMEVSGFSTESFYAAATAASRVWWRPHPLTPGQDHPPSQR